ncbi:hypothetical protein SAMN05216312_113121 [Cohnella sp. OV330]|nr:hypothetical protein SAMN05216312_113121 [Cohnella sp. OV330]
MDLKNRTAIVTGGGTGIGRAVSLELAALGVSVVVNYSDLEPKRKKRPRRSGHSADRRSPCGRTCHRTRRSGPCSA